MSNVEIYAIMFFAGLNTGIIAMMFYYKLCTLAKVFICKTCGFEISFYSSEYCSFLCMLKEGVKPVNTPPHIEGE
jgi:hypothetical protein